MLAEHRELHGLWNILTKHGGKGGRWVGKLKALYQRHEALVVEFKKRKYNHLSPLDKKLAKGAGGQKVFINTIKEQREILKKKPCSCFIHLE